MKKIGKNLELLAPAGNLEKMKTALAFGADAVYAGIPDFSLRVRINDFDLDTIKEATKYCHAKNKKIYITINIFAHNKHLKKLTPYIKKLKEIGVDALIVSDPGIINMIKKIWKDAEIHLSTQANCTNFESAKFWYEAGVKRVILGREVSLEEIKEIHEKIPDLELEYFVHGAMCMAYSGRCFLSKYYLDKSANLGDCVQPCRWKYNSREITAENHENEILELVEEEHGSYILNSKDLCLIKYLRELAEAGVMSFKIEGRAKSIYYQAMVAGIYSYVAHDLERITKDDLEYYYDELKTKLVHRGYTDGFLLGERADQNLDNSHEQSKWEFCGQVVKPISNNKEILVKVHNSIKMGDEIEIVRPKYDIIKMKVDKMIDPETGEEIEVAHGGQDRMVFLEVGEKVSEFSVIRRLL
jgi:putative protease